MVIYARELQFGVHRAEVCATQSVADPEGMHLCEQSFEDRLIHAALDYQTRTGRANLARVGEDGPPCAFGSGLDVAVRQCH